jgi:hypothetical protein
MALRPEALDSGILSLEALDSGALEAPFWWRLTIGRCIQSVFSCAKVALATLMHLFFL